MNEMKLYTSTQIDKLIQRYLDANGEAVQLEEGVLGHGKMLLMASGKKFTIVSEVAISEWSSMHTIRMYNKLPKKYHEKID